MERFCTGCNLVIAAGENFARQKKPRAKGSSDEDYEYFHHRQKGDCWFTFLRNRIGCKPLRAEIQAT